MDSRSAVVDFLAGDIHDLVIAVRVGNKTDVPDVLPEDVWIWNISGLNLLTLAVQLVGGIEKPIGRDFEFPQARARFKTTRHDGRRDEADNLRERFTAGMTP